MDWVFTFKVGLQKALHFWRCIFSNVQNQKQVDILLRYWAEDEKQVVIKYLTYLLFSGAKALDMTSVILYFLDN